MKNIEDFVKTSIKIEYNADVGGYIYFPFHMFVEKKDGLFEIAVIAGVSTVSDCYKLMIKYVLEAPKRVYLAINFPAGGDIENDFVAIYESKGEYFNIFAIPYNSKDGTIYPRINTSEQLTRIVKHLKAVSIGEWMKYQHKVN